MDASDRCRQCRATCCRYIALEIDRPETKYDYETLRWYVAHRSISVYVTPQNKWFLKVDNRCQFLNKDNLCTIYEKRPSMCRRYDPATCDQTGHDEEAKATFTTLRKLDKWLEKNRPWEKRRRRRQKK